MKRNNLLMIAYIIFIFICVVVRFLGEFPKWQVIVAAITATSWIFSLADFNYTVANELHTSSKEALECAETSIENIQAMLNTIDNFLRKNKGEAENELLKANQEQVDHYVRTRERATSCLGAYEKMESLAKKSSRLADIARKAASVLTVVGFVEFFSILSFERFSKVFIVSQDIMTVMAFGLILFTQYMGEVSKEKRQKYKKATDNINSGWKVLRKSFELEASHYAD